MTLLAAYQSLFASHGMRAAPRHRAAAALLIDSGEVRTGTCAKWDVSKGFGFISVDGEEKDIFVHNKHIVAEGFRSLREGERLEFKRIIDEGGRPCAVEVTGPGGLPVEGSADRQETQLEESDEILSGTCKWFDEERGYGFIRVDGDEPQDIFVHHKQVFGRGYRSLSMGERLEFKCRYDKRGKPEATEVTGPGGAYVLSSKRVAEQEWSGRWDAAGWAVPSLGSTLLNDEEAEGEGHRDDGEGEVEDGARDEGAKR